MRKSSTFWKQLLTDLDAKVIFDLSPGSGACAKAAMDLGMTWVGVCRSQEHQSWLQNVLDRHALTLITKGGSPLYDKVLAKCIEEHFSDVLANLHAADAAKDSDEDEGNDVE